MALLLLALLGTGLFMVGADLFGSDDDGDDTPESPETPEDPEEPDLGASLVEEDGVVTVELGEDETGSLAMITFVDTEDAGIGLAEYHEARLYLVPEASEIPEGENGVFDEAGLPVMFELDDLEDGLGLELLASWDLGEVLPTDEEPYLISTLVEPPEIETEDPLDYYYIEANTDGDDIVSIEELTGPDDTPTAEIFTIRYTLDGTVQEFRTSGGGMFGGTDADEMIETDGGTITLRGNGGDDTISLYEGSAIGGAGDDVLENLPEGGPAELFGALGDDQIVANGPDASAFGGPGMDEIDLFDGAAGFGGDGPDRIIVMEGAGRAAGGEGDDLLGASAGSATPDTVFLTGDGGADIFALSATDPAEAPAAGGVTVTDFDPAEDMLQVEGADQILDIRISTPPGGAGTLVEIDVQSMDADALPRTETLHFLLAGAPAVTAGHVVLAA
ncbi:MAG: hypothetical protein EP318_11540 [Rhodobacteraceae bacterium]|nr:MAG: hypothetical protein EP318_11540 [Paracoccaceae bacterium]